MTDDAPPHAPHASRPTCPRPVLLLIRGLTLVRGGDLCRTIYGGITLMTPVDPAPGAELGALIGVMLSSVVDSGTCCKSTNITWQTLIGYVSACSELATVKQPPICSAGASNSAGKTMASANCRRWRCTGWRARIPPAEPADHQYFPTACLMDKASFRLYSRFTLT